MFSFGADAIDGFLSDQGSLTLHSSDRPRCRPSSARSLVCKQPTKTQSGDCRHINSISIALYFIAFLTFDTYITLLLFYFFYFFFINVVYNSEHSGVYGVGSKIEAHVWPLMFLFFFCLFFLSPLLRREQFYVATATT